MAEASPAVLADADLVVVGGPTHAHGVSRETTRKSAVETAAKPGSVLKAEPGAGGPGLRDWFDALGRYPVAVRLAAGIAPSSAHGAPS